MKKFNKDRLMESVLALGLAVCLMLAGTLVEMQSTAMAANRQLGGRGADKVTVDEALGRAQAKWTAFAEGATQKLRDFPQRWSDVSQYSPRETLQLAAYQVQYFANKEPALDADAGTIVGPSGRETYYNLDMSWVISRLKEAGIEGEYYVREDGVKMYGDYIMCAADFSLRPFGTIVETSLGDAIVCDTGMFIFFDSYHVDIAATW